MSVVIPCHGRLELLAETLASLEAQTVDDFELVLADDAGDVETRRATEAMVREYGERSGRPYSYSFTDPDLGIAGNTNQAVRQATGRFIRQLHTDDLLAPQALERELETLEMLGDDVRVLFDMPIAFEEVPEWREPTIVVCDPGLVLTREMAYYTPVPSAMIVRADVLAEVGPLNPDLTFLVDWELVTRLLLHEHTAGRRVAFLTQGLVGFRLHPDSESGRRWADHFTEHARLTRRLLRTTSSVSGLWREGQRVEFRALSSRYRYHRLRDELQALPWRELMARSGDVLRCAADKDALAQVPAVALRVLAGLPTRLARRSVATPTDPASLEPGRVEGPDAEILPSVDLFSTGSGPRGRRVCTSFGRGFSVAQHAGLFRGSRQVRCWYPDEEGQRERVLTGAARMVPGDAELVVIEDPARHRTSPPVSSVLGDLTVTATAKLPAGQVVTTLRARAAAC